MNDVCGTCGHERMYHADSGMCTVLIPAAGVRHECTCRRFRSLGVLIGVRILVILVFVCALGTVEGLLGTAPR